MYGPDRLGSIWEIANPVLNSRLINFARAQLADRRLDVVAGQQTIIAVRVRLPARLAPCKVLVDDVHDDQVRRGM